MTVLALALLLPACGDDPPPSPPGRDRDGWSIDFSGEPDVPPGEVPAWARERGFERVLGNPVFFFLAAGRLHLVAKPGPIHDRRYLLAVTDRDALREGLESKVILRLTPGDFALDPERYPRVRIRMAPETLPGKGADLRDPDRNDACFYLLLGFGDPRHDFGGVWLPDTLAYVWTDRPWDEEVATDPDYEEFLRYVPIGHGAEEPGTIREITRDVLADHARAFPGSGVPRIRSVAVMVDANSVESEAASALESIRFLTGEVE
jgi:hypothetical protein